MKKVTVLFPSILLLLICLAVFLCLFRPFTHAPRPDQCRYTISRRIEYSFTLSNTTNRLVKEAGFWAYGPVRKTGRQLCEHIDCSLPFRSVTHGPGNQLLQFSIPGIPPFGVKIIRIRATVRVSGQGKCDALPAGLSDYLAPARYIESHNPEIIRLARRLKAPDAARTARNIFRWVSQNIRYTGYTGRPRGALYALSHRKGDCTEFMYLFVALCRAEGIPARCVGGYICTQDTVVRPQDYHNWAEFYLGGAWQISDPLNGVFMEGGSNYIAMRIFGGAQDDPRFEFDRFRCDSNTLRVAMNQ